MANPLAQASGMPQSMQQPSGIAELGSGWRCVKSEDYGQTYIFEPSLPANTPTAGPVPTPWGPSYPMGMAQAMSAESTARNRATLEEATNSAHFESTFFMSPLGGDGYGKTSRDIPSTIAPGRAAPALGSFEPAPSNAYITGSGMVTQPVAQLPMIAGGNGMPTGYPTGGASAIGMMNNTAGGLDMRTNMMGSWMLSQPSGMTNTSIPSILPGGDTRLAMNHMQGPQGTGQYGGGNTGNAQQLANLQQLQNLQRLASFNQSRMMGY